MDNQQKPVAPVARTTTQMFVEGVGIGFGIGIVSGVALAVIKAYITVSVTVIVLWHVATMVLTFGVVYKREKRLQEEAQAKAAAWMSEIDNAINSK